MKKKILALFVSLCMIITCSITVFAADIRPFTLVGGRIEVTPSTGTIVVYGVSNDTAQEVGMLNSGDYTLEYFKGGQSQGSTFPTAPGNYTVTATGVESRYITGSVSAEFTIEGTADVDLATCTIEVSNGGVTVTNNGSAVPSDAYTVTYYQRTTNTAPISLSGFPTSGGTYFAVATATSTGGYTGSVTSSDFVIGDGSFASLTVDPSAKTVTVKDTSGNTVPASQYELSFFKQIENGEEYVGSSFPTEPGTYVATAKNFNDPNNISMVSSLPFTISSGASEIDISNGALTVDPTTFAPTLTVGGKTVPTSAYRVDFEQVTDSDPITLVGTPTEEGTYFAVATALPNSGYTGTAMSVKFSVTKRKRLVLTPTTATVKKGFTVQINAKYNGIDATESVTWKSANSSIATVDSKGLVTGVGAGVTTITAVADEEATCTVTVTDDQSGTTPEETSQPTVVTPAEVTPSDISSNTPSNTSGNTPSSSTAQPSSQQTTTQPQTTSSSDTETQPKTETQVGVDTSGNNVKKTTSTDADGKVTTETVKTDKDGNVLSETTKTEITEVAADGTKKTTTNTTVKNESNGTEKETKTVTEIAADGTKTVNSKQTETDAEGKETVTEQKTVTDTDGTVTKDTVKTYDDGSQIMQSSVTNKNGASELSNIKFNEDGKIARIITESKTKSGAVQREKFVPDISFTDGIKLTNIEFTGKKTVIIDTEVKGADGKTYNVTTISAKALKKAKSGKVKIKLKSIDTLTAEKGAFDNMKGTLTINTEAKLTAKQKKQIRKQLNADETDEMGVYKVKIAWSYKK